MANQKIIARGVTCPEAKSSWGLDAYPHPFYHVYVMADNGYCWGCFGRGVSEVPNAELICEGFANLEWVMQIAVDGCSVNPKPCSTGALCYSRPCAGVTLSVNGICQNCANRLLLPAGIDVSNAPGNEVATFIFGKYGLGRQELIERVTKAAERVNAAQAGAITTEELEAVLERIKTEESDEYKIILDDLQQFLGVKAPDLTESVQQKIMALHGELYNQRSNTYDQFCANSLSLEQYKSTMQKNALIAFTAIAKEIGVSGFDKLFGLTPEAAVKIAFGH